MSCDGDVSIIFLDGGVLLADVLYVQYYRNTASRICLRQQHQPSIVQRQVQVYCVQSCIAAKYDKSTCVLVAEIFTGPRSQLI